MLGMKEKLQLTSELNALGRKAKDSTTPMMERLNITTQRNEIRKKLKITPEESSLSPGNTITVEEFAALPRLEQKSQIGELLSSPNWYEYEMAFDSELKLVEKGSNYVVYKTRYGYQFGYKGHISRNYGYWEKDAGSARVNGGFGSWSRADRTKAMRAINKYEAQDSGQSKENELIDKFLAREFNRSSSNEFVEVMRDVHSAGLSLDEVKNGAIEWLTANPSAMADKAA